MAIAQISRDIIQRAMEAVSRLKNMAAQTMTTGRVNTSELEIIASLVPEGSDGAVNFIPEVHTDSLIQNNIFNTKDDAKQVKILASNTNNGNVPNTEDFEVLESHLARRAFEIDKAIDSIIQGMRKTGENFSTASIPAVSEVKDSILSNSSLALTAQGNINHNVIAHYLG